MSSNLNPMPPNSYSSDITSMTGPVLSPSELTQTLADAIRHLLSQQGYPIDNVRLQDVIARHDGLSANNKGQAINELGGVIGVLKDVGINNTPEILEQPDAAFLPLLAYRADLGWGVIDGQTPQGSWNFRQEKATLILE